MAGERETQELRRQIASSLQQMKESKLGVAEIFTMETIGKVILFYCFLVLVFTQGKLLCPCLPKPLPKENITYSEQHILFEKEWNHVPINASLLSLYIADNAVMVCLAQCNESNHDSLLSMSTKSASDIETNTNHSWFPILSSPFLFNFDFISPGGFTETPTPQMLQENSMVFHGVEENGCRHVCIVQKNKNVFS